MKIDVTKIFHPEEIEAILTTKIGKNDQFVEVGEVSDMSAQSEVLVLLMEEWVKRIEVVKSDLKRLETVTKHTLDSSLLNLIQFERGITFEEYKEVFYTSTNEGVEWTRYQGFRLFNIVSERQRLQFIHKYTPDAEGYVQALLKTNLSVMSFFLGGRLKAKIPLSELFAHTHILAPSGWGKSELMKSLFYELVKKYPKYSFIVIDPHGKLSDEIKRLHISTDKDRFIYVNPFLKEGYFPCFNVFDIKHSTTQELAFINDQLLVAMNETLDEKDKVSRISEGVINKCVSFLLERGNSTLIDFHDLLTLKEPILKEAQEYSEYFGDEFIKADSRSRKAVYDRLYSLIKPPVNNNILGVESTFDLEYAMNSGKIVLFNLNGLGAPTKEAYGKFLTSYISSIASKRDTKNPLPTFVFIDECHKMVAGAFEELLQEMRKFGVALVLAHQNLDQLDSHVNAVLHNTAVKIVGGDKPKEIHLLTGFDKADVNLKKFYYYLKVRGHSVLKIKSPSYLINNPDFEMTKEEEAAFDKFQLSRYYKIVGQTKVERIPRKEGDPASPPSKQSNKPPFDLFLGHDGDATEK
jgi:hypothetical protein